MRESNQAHDPDFLQMNPANPSISGPATAPATTDAAAAGRWNMLLYWMSDLAEGSWERFRNVVTELADGEQDPAQLRRTLRVRLSDFGHVNFFVGGSSGWETLPPLAAGLLAPTGSALLTGARTPRLVHDLKNAAREHGIEVVEEASGDSPDLIRLVGPSDALRTCATVAGIEYSDNYARRLANTLDPVPLLLERPREDTDCAPINWASRSFDLQSGVWVDGTLPNAACEFTPRYGLPRYFVSNRRRRLFEIAGRRQAVYAAAYRQGVALAAYDGSTRTLSVPVSAPLPEAYARVASLCAGRRAHVSQGRIVYSDVHPEIGAVLLTALGQPATISSAVDGTQEA
jgi:hypothetical protein